MRDQCYTIRFSDGEQAVVRASKPPGMEMIKALEAIRNAVKNNPNRYLKDGARNDDRSLPTT